MWNQRWNTEEREGNAQSSSWEYKLSAILILAAYSEYISDNISARRLASKQAGEPRNSQSLLVTDSEQVKHAFRLYEKVQNFHTIEGKKKAQKRKVVNWQYDAYFAGRRGTQFLPRKKFSLLFGILFSRARCPKVRRTYPKRSVGRVSIRERGTANKF